MKLTHSRKTSGRMLNIFHTIKVLDVLGYYHNDFKVSSTGTVAIAIRSFSYADGYGVKVLHR